MLDANAAADALRLVGYGLGRTCGDETVRRREGMMWCGEEDDEEGDPGVRNDGREGVDAVCDDDEHGLHGEEEGRGGLEAALAKL